MAGSIIHYQLIPHIKVCILLYFMMTKYGVLQSHNCPWFNYISVCTVFHRILITFDVTMFGKAEVN